MGLILYYLQALFRTISEILSFIITQLNKVFINDKKFDYFIATLFILTSGSVWWLTTFGAAGAFIILLLVGIINVVRKKRRLNNSWLFILIVMVICSLNAVILQRQYEDNSMLGYIVCITATYLIISQYDFLYFVKLLTNVLVVILVIAIPVYLLCSFNIIPAYHKQMLGTPFMMSGYIFTIGWWEPFERFSGLWHEPGACQILLNSILWLNFKKIQKWELTKHDKIKFTIILIGIILTKSTAGYLVFLCFLLAIGFTSKVRSRHRLVIYTVLCVSMISASIVLFNDDVIQKKLFNEPGKESVSKRDRKKDAIAFIKVANLYPLTGAGIGTDLFFKKAKEYGMSARSSGILLYTASLGYTWLLLFMYTCFVRIRRLKYGEATLFLFISVLIMQNNEMYIEYPITNLFIFKFHSYLENV